MPFLAVVGFFGVLSTLPTLIRAVRSRWGSPELRATLHAVGIAIALDAIPLFLWLLRGQRRPQNEYRYGHFALFALGHSGSDSLAPSAHGQGFLGGSGHHGGCRGSRELMETVRKAVMMQEVLNVENF
jgi:hypothetical protein